MNFEKKLARTISDMENPWPCPRPWKIVGCRIWFPQLVSLLRRLSSVPAFVRRFFVLEYCSRLSLWQRQGTLLHHRSTFRSAAYNFMSVRGVGAKKESRKQRTLDRRPLRHQIIFFSFSNHFSSVSRLDYERTLFT